jgi:hypothetical protein
VLLDLSSMFVSQRRISRDTYAFALVSVLSIPPGPSRPYHVAYSAAGHFMNAAEKIPESCQYQGAEISSLISTVSSTSLKRPLCLIRISVSDFTTRHHHHPFTCFPIYGETLVRVLFHVHACLVMFFFHNPFFFGPLPEISPVF